MSSKTIKNSSSSKQTSCTEKVKIFVEIFGVFETHVFGSSNFFKGKSLIEPGTKTSDEKIVGTCSGKVNVYLKRETLEELANAFKTKKVGQKLFAEFNVIKGFSTLAPFAIEKTLDEKGNKVDKLSKVGPGKSIIGIADKLEYIGAVPKWDDTVIL